MQTKTAISLPDIDPVDWDRLAAAESPFLKHGFLCALELSGSVGPGTGWTPAHQLVFDADGKLEAALPAYLKTHSFGEYVFDHGWADACERAGIAYYPKLLAGIPFSPVTGPRLLGDTQLVGQVLDSLTQALDDQGLSSLHINFTDPAADALMRGREGWLERLGCQFHWHNRQYRDFQDFLDSLISRKRKQLRKEREQVAGQGIEFEWREGHQLSESEWDFVYVCYANTYRVRGRAPYLTRVFFSLLAEKMPESIRVVIARQGTQPVAMAFSLVGGNSFYGRYWGCLAEFDRLHFETCFYQGMEYAIASGLERFDAGAQGEHKLIRGFEPVITRSWHYLCHPGLRAAVAQFLEQEREGISRYALEARSLLPYRQADGSA
ncbi:GNAT family N-acetyltransferase [Pseudomonas segetis]